MPETSAYPGYTRVLVDVGTEQPINCFVYDGALDPGQALTRLLRAAEVGIEFTRFEPVTVELAGGTPLVFLQAHYQRTEEPKGRGLLKLAFSPRANHPMVCTHEELRLRESFRRIVRGAVGSFHPEVDFADAGLSAGDEKVAVETWALVGEGPYRGYTQWRVARLPDGRRHELSVTTLIAVQGNRIDTVDSISAELSDEIGLVEGKWIQVEGTTPALRLELRRDGAAGSESFSYSVEGRAGLEVVNREFLAPALSTGFDTLQFFHQAGPFDSKGDANSAVLMRYFPQLSLDRAVEVTLRKVSPNSGELVRDGANQTMALDSSGLPVTIGEPVGAKLLERELFAAFSSGDVK